MESLTINTSTNKYNVSVGAGLRHQIPNLLTKKYKSILIITDSEVGTLYLEDVEKSLVDSANVYSTIVPAGEASKSNQQYFKLISKAIEVGLDRSSLIVALGGGVIGDLAGFVAATYMRGIDYIQIPTTILAHDSSVGGKVAINHPSGKNLIGSFYPPQAVIYDVETLHTLPQSEIRSGYAEVVKHGLISDESFFKQVIETDIRKRLSDHILSDHLIKGINVKATIVENDEKESNIRKYLNFGHTLGHALEAELGYGKLTHGEAVAIGMLFALRVSNKIYNTNLPYDTLFKWLKDNKYPLNLPMLNLDKLIKKMQQDKKSVNRQVQMVLLKQVGSPVTKTIDDDQLKVLLSDFVRELVVE